MATEEARERKLAVILHADVVGSTVLVQRDETLAHQRITDAFTRFSEAIQSYRGTVHEIRGDALVAEFPRASDAVSAALAFQRLNAAHNEQLSDAITPFLRVGISLGEVVIADDTVTGPGVVLAQRVEQLAEAGGVCATAAIYEAAPGRLPFDYLDLGAQSAKGFDEPVHVYAVAMKSDASVPTPEPLAPTAGKTAARARKILVSSTIAVVVLAAGVLLMWLQPWQPDVPRANPEAMAFALPDQPSIAVLPLDNFGGSKETEVIADGFSEHIISTLARIPELFVVARNSTFRYKGKAVEIREVAEELGVQHVLEGSVQFDDQTMRLTVQLIDALSGKHVWSAHYDRAREDLFAVQDEVTLAIARELQGKLTQGQMARIRHRTTTSIEAWALGARAYTEFNRFGIPALRESRRLAREAVAVDPNYAWPWVLIAYINVSEVRFGLAKDRNAAIVEAEHALAEAKRLAPELPELLAATSFLYSQTGRLDEAAEVARKAEELAPNHAEVLATFSAIALLREEWQETRRLAEKAMRLQPYYPAWYLSHAAFAYKHLGMEKEAIWAFEERAARNEKLRGKVSRYQLGDLAVCYATFGRWDDAKRTIARLLQEYPNHSAKASEKILRGWYPREALLKENLEILVQAGLPENPPLPLPDKPSIAVLAFNNMSDDPKQDYFAEGIAEDITTDLSKLGGLFVIGRNSSFSYKGKNLPIKAIARELGVKYVLKGSVRRAGDTLRVNTQLIDAETDGHIWAERYDGALTDVFILQDKVTSQVISALAVAVTPEEQRRVNEKGTESVAAYEAFQRGMRFVNIRGYVKLAENLAAREEFQSAMALDPKYALAQAGLALTFWTYFQEINSNDNSFREEAFRLADGSLALEDNWLGRIVRSRRYLIIGGGLGSLSTLGPTDHDAAVTELRMAVALAPNNADALAELALALVFSGASSEAAELMRQAKRRNPNFPTWYHRPAGMASYMLGSYEEAVREFTAWYRSEPLPFRSVHWLAAAYAQKGEIDEARKALDDLSERLGENRYLQFYERLYPFRMDEDRARFVEAFRKAGEPDAND